MPSPIMKRLASLCLCCISATAAWTTTSRSHPSSYWYIDGNNMLGAPSIPKNVDTLFQAFGQIRPKDSVFLVLDGPKKKKNDEEEESAASSSSSSSPCETVLGSCTRIELPSQVSADEYIITQIKQLQLEQTTNNNNSKLSVHVVTADRDLRKRVLSIQKPKKVVDTVINPVVFWKRYVPRLSGYPKRTQKQQQEQEKAAA